MLLLFRASSAGSLCNTPTTTGLNWLAGKSQGSFMQISSTYRKSHISELLDKTVHDPRLIGLVGHLSLITKEKLEFCFSDVNHLCYFIDGCPFLTLPGPFLGPLPQELQEELLSWEAGLFHMSPSSASHWPVDMLMSSPPFPQLSCIGLGPGEGTQVRHTGSTWTH